METEDHSEEAQPAGEAPSPILWRDDELRGIRFAIEYRDAVAHLTNRRVTLLSLYETKKQAICLRCLCHERRATRAFRLDRVISVIDMDGVVWQPPARFFTEELKVAFPVGTVPTVSCPGYTQRAVAKDGAQILMAISHADGHIADEELAVILDYVTYRCAVTNVAYDDQDLQAMSAYFRRQFPDRADLNGCLERLARQTHDEQKRFIRSAIAVMDADGLQHPEEFNLLLEIEHALQARTH